MQPFRFDSYKKVACSKLFIVPPRAHTHARTHPHRRGAVVRPYAAVSKPGVADEAIVIVDQWAGNLPRCGPSLAEGFIAAVVMHIFIQTIRT